MPIDIVFRIAATVASTGVVIALIGLLTSPFFVCLGAVAIVVGYCIGVRADAHHR